MPFLALLVLVSAACAGQKAPERTPLPDVVVTPRPPCAVLLGDGIGAKVVGVEAGTGAAEILEDGDVLTAVDGQRITTAAELIRSLAGHKAGDVIETEFTRAGIQQDATIPLTFDEELEKPILGVNARTAYLETAPEALPGDEALTGDFVRYVIIDRQLYAFDPVALNWAKLALEEPDEPYVAVGDEFVQLLSSESGPMLRTVGGDDTPLSVADWVPVHLVEPVGQWVALVAVRPSIEDIRQIAVLAVDPGSGALAWATMLSTGPRQSFGSPDGSLLAFVGPDGLSVIDRFGRFVAQPDVFAAAGITGVFGWFDANHLLVGTLQGFESLAINDAAISPVELGGTRNADISGVWPVGDGRHVLVATTGSLERVDTVGTEEARRIVESCFVEVGPNRGGNAS